VSSGRLAVGVDVALERKGLDLVALDARRTVVASCGRLSLADVARWIAELRPSVVCIDSPPAWAASGSHRAAERALWRMGIGIFGTPGIERAEHRFYAWMRAGFAVFAQIRDTFPLYLGGVVEQSAAEVFPHASAVLLAGRLPCGGESKLRFRRAVIDAQGIAQSALPNIDRVDAALAALTGQIALDGGHSHVGDPDEGTILLPVPALPQTLRAAHSQ
jgi:predicted nuclease with RNAse H fold